MITKTRITKARPHLKDKKKEDHYLSKMNPTKIDLYLHNRINKILYKVNLVYQKDHKIVPKT